MYIAWINGRDSQSIGISFADGASLRECKNDICDKIITILKIQKTRLGTGNSYITITKGENQKIVEKITYSRGLLV